MNFSSRYCWLSVLVSLSTFACVETGCHWQSFNLHGPNSSSPKAIVPSSCQDFGTVAAGQIQKTEFPVHNSGNRRLVLNAHSTSCSCATGSATIVVPPGESTFITAELGTEQLEGSFAFQIAYATNDPTNPILKFELLANVKATAPDSVSDHTVGDTDDQNQTDPEHASDPDSNPVSVLLN